MVTLSLVKRVPARSVSFEARSEVVFRNTALLSLTSSKLLYSSTPYTGVPSGR